MRTDFALTSGSWPPCFLHTVAPVRAGPRQGCPLLVVAVQSRRPWLSLRVIERRPVFVTERFCQFASWAGEPYRFVVVVAPREVGSVEVVDVEVVDVNVIDGVGVTVVDVDVGCRHLVTDCNRGLQG